MSEDDLKRGLLGKREGNFDKLYEECLIKIQRIKQKNDFMQKQIGTDVEDSIREQVSKQRDFIEKEIREIKNLMLGMDNKFKDLQSKNRMKQLKTEAQKQIERNKVILKDYINKSFIVRSRGDHQDQDTGSYLEGGAANYVHLNGPNKPAINKQESLLTDQQIEIDYDLERKMLEEKNEMLNDVEQATLRINDMMNDMGVMVDEQGENLDIISEELLKANTNLVAANEHLEEAGTLQKKSRKKYMILLLIIVLVVAAVAGIVFIVA